MSQESVPKGFTAIPFFRKRSGEGKPLSARVREARLGWLLVAPAFIVVVGMVGYPFVESIRISFTDKMIGRGPGEFVGLANYEYILGWPAFGEMVVRTVLFTIAAVIAKTVVGLILATALNQNFKGRNVLRGVFMLPWILPTYIIVLVWRWILDGQTGVLNQILVNWGIVDANIPFLAKPGSAIAALIFVLTWKGYPFYALTFLAGMQTISPELYDAAKVDGAGRLARFVYITLPGLRQVMGVVILLSTIWTMNSLEIPLLLTGGGPSNKTEVFPLLTYHLAMQNFRLGEGAAVPILMLPVIGLLIFFVARYLEREAIS
ncbi:MAG: sugar ABC transporter permease [Caldilineaceae bacterium]|nr:sugar ABC transporter permease [Caldilineaceae bacterium]